MVADSADPVHFPPHLISYLHAMQTSRTMYGAVLQLSRGAICNHNPGRFATLRCVSMLR